MVWKVWSRDELKLFYLEELMLVDERGCQLVMDQEKAESLVLIPCIGSQSHQIVVSIQLC